MRYRTDDGRHLFDGPAGLGLIQRGNGRMAGLSRTWLGPLPFDPAAYGEKGRAPIIDPLTGKTLSSKKALGAWGLGHAVRLIRGTGWRDGHETGFPGDVLPPHGLTLGEGMETVLAMATALKRQGALDPMMAFWAAAGLDNLAEVKAPPSVGHVVLLGDGDSNPATTRRVLARAVDMHRRAGASAATAWARQGRDFSSMLMEQAAAGAALAVPA